MENNLLLIKRVIIKNYKSIPYCDVRLGPLTFLVGRNGAGKSNFLDALSFTKDTLDSGVEHALRERGGIKEVRRQSGGHPQNFGMRVEFNLPDGRSCHYAFEFSSGKAQKIKVKKEQCIISGKTDSRYFIENGSITETGKNKETMPPVADDRLYLPAASAFEDFRAPYDALRGMRFYNINPDVMRKPQRSDPDILLKKDGANIAMITINKDSPEKKIVRDYLNNIADFVTDFKKIDAKGWQMVEFKQDVKSQRHPWQFSAQSMSDGTLRAFGVLTALFQNKKENGLNLPTLIGIEEPETALHAIAMDALMEALREASEDRQIIVTTHSTELLDCEIDEKCLLPVALKDSETRIGGLDEGVKKVLIDHLATPGELLRQNQLSPKNLFATKQRAMPLFESN